MKYKLLLLTSLFFISLTASECKKHKTPGNPVDQLPPETQTGANTFGCLINGQAFLPKGPSLGPILKCAYQFLNTNYSQGYFFQLSASHKNNTTDVVGIGIFTDSLAIHVGNFTLSNNQTGNAAGQYARFNDQGNTVLYTNSNLPGQLIITKFDDIDQIVSGKFWFSVVKTPGDTFNYPQSTVAYTKSDLPGQLTITRFDEINQIVSGTFTFSVVKTSGDTLKITEGRFDMQFTK